MRAKVITFVTLVVLLILCATPVYGQEVPPLPHAFYGTVEINDSPAPIGTQVEARGEGVRAAIEGNPVATTAVGSYGSPDPMGPKLVVQGDILDGTTITFYVNGVSTEQTAEWHSGEVTELDLTVTILDTTPPAVVSTSPDTDATNVAVATVITAAFNEAMDASTITASSFTLDSVSGSVSYDSGTYTTTFTPSANLAYSTTYTATLSTAITDAAGNPLASAYSWSFTTTSAPAGGGGGGGGAPPTLPPGTTSLEAFVDYRGMFTQTVTAVSSDSLCRLTIDKGAIGLTKDGEPLSEIKMAQMEAPPAPPEHTHFVGLVYNFGPDGATFNPAVTVEYSYDPSNIPERVAEENLVLAWWDVKVREWVTLDSVVDPEANTISAPVSHFTAFSTLAYTRPAAFITTGLNISPTEVDINESVTISVWLTNTGDEAGSYEVTLKINNAVEASKEVTLNGGASEKVTFATAKDVAGSYSVDVDGLSGSFTVKEKPAPPPAPPPPISPPAPVVNWPLIWGIIGGVVAVGVIIFLAVRKRKA